MSEMTSEDLRDAEHDGRTRPASDEAFLTRLLDTLPYPVSYLDAGLVYTQCNAAAAATVGRTPAEVVGQSVASIVGADSEVVTLLRRVLESGEPYSGVIEFTDPGSGRTSHYRASYVPEVDAEGRTLGVLTNVVDVSELVLSQRRFRSIFQSMTEGVALHELVYEDGRAVDYRVLEVNPAFEAHTGLSAESARGKLAGELYGTDDPPFLAAYTQVAETGDPISFETYFAPLERHFRVTAVCPLPGRFATVFQDVTGAKLAGQELRKRADLLDLTSEAIFAWRFDGGIEYWNKGAEELYGYAPEEAVGKVSHDLLATVFPESASKVRADLERDGTWQGELVHTTRDGRKIVVETRQQLGLSGDGPLVLETNRDVTERTRALEELRESEERFRSFLESTRDVVYRVDVQTGRYDYVSPSVKHVVGFSASELMALDAETSLASVHPEDLPSLRKAMRACEEVGEAEAEYRQRTKQGDWAWMSNRMTLIRDADGIPLYRMGSIRDVTEAKLAEDVRREREAEETAQQERTRLARDLHDSVTQVLFAAALKAEALTLVEGMPGSAGGTAAEVERLSRSALAEMRTLLLELRGEPLEDVTLERLLGYLVQAAQGRTSAELRLDFRAAKALPPALHVATYRVVQEALNNAVRHAKAENVWVVFEATGQAGRLEIGDDGVGFDPAAVDPGHLGLKSMRERAEGAGAGLNVTTEKDSGTQVVMTWSRISD